MMLDAKMRVYRGSRDKLHPAYTATKSLTVDPHMRGSKSVPKPDLLGVQSTGSRGVEKEACHQITNGI